MAREAQGVFTLVGARALGAAPEVLGFWTTARAPEEAANGGVAIEAGATVGAEMLIWRVNLPAEKGRATEALGKGEAHLTASMRALDESQRRLAALVNAQTRGTAFDVDAAVLRPPEANLLNTLRDYELARQSLAFGLGEELAGDWGQALQTFHSVMDRLIKCVAYYAWVETQVEGRLMGRTVVSWSGGFNTVWCRLLTGGEAALHERSLTLALASRDFLLRAFAVSCRGAVLLTTLPALLATPAGALIALPAVWKFINQVLSDLDEP